MFYLWDVFYVVDCDGDGVIEVDVVVCVLIFVVGEIDSYFGVCYVLFLIFLEGEMVSELIK